MIIDQIIVEDMERGNRVDIIIEWFPCGGTQSWIGLDSGWNTVVWVTRHQEADGPLERNVVRRWTIIKVQWNPREDRRGTS